MTLEAYLVRHIVSKLECPFCFEPFHSVHELTITEGKTYGYLKCLCDVFPIVHSIIYLKKDMYRTNKKAVSFIQKKNYSAAILLLIDGYTPKEKKYIQLLFRLSLIRKNFMIFIFTSLKYINPYYKAWYTYILNRKNRITYIMSLAHISLCKRRGIVIDAGCGFSHYLYDIHNYRNSLTLCGIENSFSMLYFSSISLGSEGRVFICQDLNMGIPFRSNSVSRLFANDMFMYLYRKGYFFQELQRTLRTSGIAILCHVHSKVGDNFVPGYDIDLQEMQSYVKSGTLLGIEDRLLFQHIQRQRAFRYKPLYTLDTSASSFSFLFTPQKIQGHKVTPFKNLSIPSISLQSIDENTEILHRY